MSEVKPEDVKQRDLVLTGSALVGLFAAGVAAFIALYFNAVARDTAQAETGVTTEARNAGGGLCMGFYLAMLIAQKIAGTYASLGVLSIERHMAMSAAAGVSTGTSASNPYMLVWAPIISNSDRVAMENIVQTGINKSFEILNMDVQNQLVTAGVADYYAPVLEMSVRTGFTTHAMFGVDLMSLPNLKESIDAALSTKQIVMTKPVCDNNPFVGDTSTCGFLMNYFVLPIVYNNIPEAMRPRPAPPTPASPFAGLTDMVLNGKRSGDVVGLLVGRLKWHEALLQLATRMSVSTQNSLSGKVTLFEDVTNLPGYPIASCNDTRDFKFHNIQFGYGVTFFQLFGDYNEQSATAEAIAFTKVLPTKSYIVCVGGRQINIAYVATMALFDSLRGQSASVVLILGLGTLATLGCVFVAKFMYTFIKYRAEKAATQTKIAKKKTEVDAYSDTMNEASNLLEKPLQDVMASSKTLSAGDVAARMSRKVSTNVEIMTLSATKMWYRLMALKTLATTGDRFRFDVEEFDVRVMIVNMIKLHRSFGKVALHWKVHSTVPVRVRAAMVAMEQIMANGLTNSCKFCYHADGIIRVEADMVDENTIRVMVCDNGKGLGGKTEEEIFTAFGGVAVKPTEGVPIGTLTGQSETATVKPVEAEKKVASSGLGLTFCKEAAQSLGGRVNLLDKSKTPDGFTKLVLVLPVEVVSVHPSSIPPHYQTDFVGSLPPLDEIEEEDEDWDGDEGECVRREDGQLPSIDENPTQVYSEVHKEPINQGGEVEIGGGRGRIDSDTDSNPISITPVTPDTHSTSTGTTPDMNQSESAETTQEEEVGQLPGLVSKLSSSLLPPPFMKQMSSLSSAVRSPTAKMPPMAPKSSFVPIKIGPGSPTEKSVGNHSNSNVSIHAPRPPLPLIKLKTNSQSSSGSSRSGNSDSRGASAMSGIGFGDGTRIPSAQLHAFRNSVVKSTCSSSQGSGRSWAKENGVHKLPPLVKGSKGVTNVLILEPDMANATLIPMWGGRGKGFHWRVACEWDQFENILRQSGDLRTETIVELDKRQPHHVVHKFDVCIIEMDSIGMAECVRKLFAELDEQGSTLQFLAVASGADHMEKRALLNMGFRHVISKPYTEVRITQAIVKALTTRQPWMSRGSSCEYDVSASPSPVSVTG